MGRGRLRHHSHHRHHRGPRSSAAERGKRQLEPQQHPHPADHGGFCHRLRQCEPISKPISKLISLAGKIALSLADGPYNPDRFTNHNCEPQRQRIGDSLPKPNRHGQRLLQPERVGQPASVALNPTPSPPENR
jgi:hypothetical protein